MNVKELRELLKDVPEHLDVCIGLRGDGSGGGADIDFADAFSAEISSTGFERIFLINLDWVKP